MKNLNARYAYIIRSRYDENVISGREAVNYMQNSKAIFHGVPIECLYMPKIFSKEAWSHLNKAAEMIISIIDKVISRYLSDAEYRKLFPFPKELEELILLESGYKRLLPIARIDIFLNEDDYSFKFCEFNADGAGGMTECMEINAATQKTDAFIKMQDEHKIAPFELFETWVREFMDIYGTYDKKIENPRVVITDFMDKATPNEFNEFKKRFVEAGIDADICEIRDFTFQNGVLKTPDGKKVDAVYRRAVTRDVMENRNEIPAFLQAARERAVCIIGHFRTQVIHNKSVFMIMRMEETLSFLSDEEREYVLRHVPETLPLRDDENLNDVMKNKDNWILKPEDFYAAKGVFAGVDKDEASWREAVTEALHSGVPYLIQRYCTPYKSQNLDFNGVERPEFKMYNNITGMYVYNGKLIGLYSRAGQMGTISSLASGKTLASMIEV